MVKKIKKNSKIISILPLVAILLLLTFGVSYAVVHNSKHPANAVPTGKTTYAPATYEEKKQVEDSKLSDKTSTPAVSPPSAPTPVTTTSVVVIISAEQDGNKNLVVKTQLNGQHWSSCSLAVMTGGTLLTKSAGTLYQTDFSTCTGFVIKAAELSSGSATLTLTAKTDSGAEYTSAPKTIDITK